MDAPALENGAVLGTDHSSASGAGSELPNEKLLLLVQDFPLASRLLTVRIYQVFHTSAASVDFAGLRVAATDEVDNDYALFISRVKCEQLHHAQHSSNPMDHPSPAAIASSVLSHLDIVGNRHRDVGRLTCRALDAATHVDHKPRAAPRPTPSSSKQPTKAEDKRTSRNKLSQQRAMDAIAASHSHPHEMESLVVSTNTSDAISKVKSSRKSSEMSLLHRMANADATTVWRSGLEGINDESGESNGEEEGEEEVIVEPNETTLASHPTHHSKRAVPDRKPKYSELQRRRDKERKQRLQLVRPIVSLQLSSAGIDHSVPPRQASPHRQQDSASSLSPPDSQHRPSRAISSSTHAAAAIEVRGTGTPPEAEQFLRRKTIVENQNRVFKAEGVFDEAMGVEITHERPDHRFHTPEHAPPSPEPIALSKRKTSTTKNRRPQPAGRADGTKRPLSSAKSAPVLPSPRDLATVKVLPEPLADVTTPAALDTTRTEPNPKTSVREEDTVAENVSLPAPAALVTVENTVGAPAEGGETRDDFTQLTPRSARTVEVIDIHPEDQDENSEVHDIHEGEPMSSPRVECWEEESTVVSERIETVVDPTLHDSGTEPIDDTTQHWAAPVEQALSPDDDEQSDAQQPHHQSADEPSRVDIPPVIMLVDESTEDPIVEVEVLPLVQPGKENSTPPHSAEPSPLRRGASMSRRGSIMDAASSAIAMAAAAAAVAAAAVPPVESVQSSTSRTSTPNEGKLTSRKRRSQDATPSQTARHHMMEGQRDAQRRSTIHFFHMTEEARVFVAEEAGIAANQSQTGRKASTKDMVVRTPIPEKEKLSATSRISLPSSSAEQKPTQPSTPNQHHRQRSAQEIAALQQSPSYPAKWHKWANGKQLLDKVSCLQLEEQLLQDPTSAATLVKLGLRYARWPATSLPAVLLLENEAVVHDDGTSAHLHEYWNALGNAHFDVFLRHRKFLPAAVFHLSKSLQALTRAFAFLKSAADPLLLLRYAICMYWKKSDDGTTKNLEHADDIVRELFGKFASFCDKDRLNVLFFHFQILCRLKTFSEAIECLHKIVAIHETSQAALSEVGTSSPSIIQGGAPPPYDASDYLLMLMHCQQASGDFLQASTTFSQLLKTLQAHKSDLPCLDGSTWSDHEYLQLWGALADKCFHHEDYALAIEFYAITATYAKDSRVLARVLYHHALCFQAIGDSTKCSAEFKRAKNINRHIAPFATLTEIHARYDDEYAALLRTPVARIVDNVRQNLYDRAVTSLQRLFRRKKKGGEHGTASHGGAEDSMTARSLDRHRSSVVASLTNLVEGSGNRKVSRLPPGVTHGRRSATIIDPHEAFLYRQTIAMQKLEQIRGRQFNRTSSMRVVSPSEKLAVRTQSGLLSPVADRPDLRRKHSMDSLAKRLGYLPANGEQFIGYWEELVATSLDLYETQTEYHRLVARIRSVLPLVSEAVACCSLADAVGNVDRALEQLHDTTYEQELQLVSTVVDLPTIVQRHFANQNENTSQRTRFPPIQSPVKNVSSMPVKHESLSPKLQPAQISLPPCKSSPRTSFKAVRLSSLIDAQFEDAGRGRPDDTVGGQRLRELDQFAVIEDFRAVNTSLLHGWQR